MAPRTERASSAATGLVDLQAEFLADLGGTRSRSASERSGVFEKPPAGTIEDRWGVYTSGYLARLVEVIGHDYRAVRRVVGERAWRSLVARYVRVFSPRSHDVARAGDRLAVFLERDPLRERLPFLPDLARFEHALARAFVAPDAEPLSWVDLGAGGAEAAAERRLCAAPGTAVLCSAWPLGTLRELVDVPDDAVDVQVAGRPENVLVWRRGLAAAWRRIDDAEASAVEAILAGTTLAELSSSGPREDIVALIGTIRRLVEDGVIAATVRGCEEGEAEP